jgi:uncharacterized protein YpbB
MVDRDILSSVLRTFVVQVLRKHHDSIPFVYEHYYQQGSGRSTSTMKKILKDVLLTLSSVHIVVDGLDECNELLQVDLLSVFEETRKLLGQTCKILVASRPCSSVERIARKRATVDMRGETVQAIRLYIKEEIAKLQVEKQGEGFQATNGDLFLRLEEHLNIKADGKYQCIF